MPRCSAARGRTLGFAYLLLLIAVAVIAIATAAAVSVGTAMQRRAAEEQLLVIGAELERALAGYQGNAAGGFQGPKTLEDLLRDPRSPTTRRHLRQIYADPLTGQPQWGLVKGPDGTISGVYSLAEGQPIKQHGFDPQHATFEGAATYAQWVFQAPAALPPMARRP